MLYLVATPIGNLKDITYRAVETLNSVDEIACEDTRRSLGLLNHYNIKKPLVAYHKFNEREAGEKLVEKLKSGKNIALITDAGMPIISDPGSVLVNLLVQNGLEFTVVPGACALVSAIALAGVDGSRFCFLGFLPDKANERAEYLEKYKNLDMTLIFYSAPHDIVRNIQSIYSVFGDRKAVAVKEITKIHETTERFSLKDGLKGEPKGEYVLLVEPSETQNPLLKLSPKEHLDFYLSKGFDKKEALKMTAKDRGVSKSELYKLTIED